MKSFLHNKKSFSMSLKRNFYLRLQNRQDKQVRLTFLKNGTLKGETKRQNKREFEVPLKA